MTNQEAIKRMRDWMTYRGLSTSTQKNYVMHVELLSRYFGKPLFDLDKEHIKEYLYNEAINRKLSSSYTNLIHASIKLLYECVLERDSVMKNIPRRKDKGSNPTILSKKEVTQLIQATENIRDKALLLTIYSSGLRLSEAANLRVEDIDSENMRIFIRKGKGGKDRYSLLANSTLEILREYYRQYRPNTWLFQGRNPKDSLSCKTIQHIFRKAKNKLSINRKISVHSLRHAFATHSIENGSSILALKEILGHCRLETTSHYIHLSNRNTLKMISPADTLGGILHD